MSICAPPCTCKVSGSDLTLPVEGFPCPRHGRAEFEILTMQGELVARRARAQLDAQELERQIAGALKSAIDAHGPIHRSGVSSAAKRIARQIEGRQSEKTSELLDAAQQ